MHLSAQPSITANDSIPKYYNTFGFGTNMGWNPPWTDEQLADLAAGNPEVGIDGIGANCMRPALFEFFLENWSYDIRVPAFEHYKSLGMRDHTAFIGYPAEWHRDLNFYCDDRQSNVFRNLYEPIWDDGSDGTPINEENFYANYLYKMVPLYKDYITFWEIWNEPDFDHGGNAWKPRGLDGNWWENDPPACETALSAPFYNYIRMLRISYEVIKSIDPDAMICTGGLGYTSFLDAIMRNTDNPDSGKVSIDYPLKGGAYFDVLSYHAYPHLEGMRTWSNEIFNFVYQRHSDKAVELMIEKKRDFAHILFEYGYNGVIYPQKFFINTECNIPRKGFNDNIGSDEAQRNFNIKALVAAQKEGLLQYHIYNLAEATNPVYTHAEFNFMGLYKQIRETEPYTYSYTQGGVAYKTCISFLKDHYYDYQNSTFIDTIPEVDGGVFRDSRGNKVMVLWAKTHQDLIENPKFRFKIPAEHFEEDLIYHRWDHCLTNRNYKVNAPTIELTGSPIFITKKEEPNASNTVLGHLIFTANPNPFKDILNIQFTDPSSIEKQINIFDSSGFLVYQIQKTTDDFLEIQLNHLSTGVFYVKVVADEKSYIKKVVKF